MPEKKMGKNIPKLRRIQKSKKKVESKWDKIEKFYDIFIRFGSHSELKISQKRRRRRNLTTKGSWNFISIGFAA